MISENNAKLSETASDNSSKKAFDSETKAKASEINSSNNAVNAEHSAINAAASADAAKDSEDKAKTSEIISTANTAEVAKNLETVRDIKAEIDILDANVSANAASSNENANNARISAEAAKQSETNAALSEASALESKNASAENAAKSQNNASNAKNSADSAKESETKAQEYSNLSQSNANASSESASNAKASEDASKKNADDSAATLQELKDGIASGNFKGEKGDKGDPGAPGKDATVDTTLTHEGEAADAKATGDAISAVKARQNILTGTETGNPIAVDDAFSAPLCGLTVYGRSTQDGTPTPDAPVPIVSAGDGGSVVVKVTGKNLIQPYEKDTRIAKNGVTMDYNVASQLVHVYGTATGMADIFDTRQEIPLSVKSNVTMSITVRAGKIPDGVIIQYSDFVTLGLSCTGSKPYDTGAFNRPDAPGSVRFAMNIPKGTTVDFTIAVQLELGRTVTAYSPYREQLLTLPTPNGLPGIPVTSGGNYTDENGQRWVCDEVDLERGVKVQRVKVLNLLNSSGFDNNGTWHIATNQLGAGTSYTPLEWFTPAIKCLCNTFPVQMSKYQTGTDANLSIYYSQTGDVITLKSALFNPKGQRATVDEAKAWFTAHPTYLYVPIEPIETPLTPAEIAAYKALTAYGPDTVVQAGDGAGVKLDYQRDVSLVVKNLEDAIASMTTT